MQTPPYRFLQTDAEVARWLESVGSETTLALDFEADSLHSYREKVCLVQMSTRSAHVILDPLAARSTVPGLGPLLADPGVEKVLHGGDYDLRLLRKDRPFEIVNVFDTAIAAQFTGRSQFGLAALLEEHFDVHLDKKYQRANWSARPLPPELLAYAALDTAYLLPLKDKLQEELTALGRMEWAREEFRLLEAVTPTPSRPPWCLDVKGAGRLHPRQLAVLQALLEVRDGAAREWDRPPFKVLSNNVLLDWAASPPKARGNVLGTPGASPRVLFRLSEKILEAVEKAQALPLSQCPTPEAQPRRDPLDREQEARLKRLKRARSRAAERLGLAVGLLVNSATLERLARKPPGQAVRCLPEHLKRWQMQAVGQELRKALGE